MLYFSLGYVCRWQSDSLMVAISKVNGYFLLAPLCKKSLKGRQYMRITLPNVCAVVLAATVSFTPIYAADADSNDDRMARMEARLIAMEARLAAAENGPTPAASNVSEARIVELEARLAEAEQETKEVKILASSGAVSGGSSSSLLGNEATFDILAGSAWRNLRWTHEEQWEGIKRGITEEKVIELLGYPPRSLDSLKPRIDKVYWYEASIRDWNSEVSGKISFRKGKVVSFEKPNFDKLSRAAAEHAIKNKKRLP